jgi:transmembrane sensor
MSETRLNPRGEDPGTRLPDPLSSVLRSPMDEESVPRMWRRIDERRLPVRIPLGVVLGWAILGAGIAVATMFAVNLVWEHSSAHPPPSALHATQGPLLLRDGGPLVTVDVAGSEQAKRVDLADGSRLDIDPGARLEPLASSDREVVLRLARGRAVFRIEPGGPRRWVIEAGLASIEVVGTGFSVSRRNDAVRVDVDHGVVLVRGQQVPDGVMRLEAGGSIEVHEPASPSLPATEGSAGPARTSSIPLGGGSAPKSTWREAASRGKYVDAYVALGSDGLARETASAASADDLFALADIARLSGHPAEAVDPLKRLVAQYASSSRAALAAVTLGRIELELGEAEKAARALERALVLGVPAGLQEDVFARLVEAHVKAGHPNAARAVASDYAERFPNGRRRADIEQWLRQ